MGVSVRGGINVSMTTSPNWANKLEGDRPGVSTGRARRSIQALGHDVVDRRLTPHSGARPPALFRCIRLMTASQVPYPAMRVVVVESRRAWAMLARPSRRRVAPHAPPAPECGQSPALGPDHYDVRRVSAGGQVQSIRIRTREHTPEGPLTGHHEPALRGIAVRSDPLRTSCELLAAHCHIATAESLPTTRVAHVANTRITSNGCCRPSRPRRSGTCPSLLTRYDRSRAGSASNSVSHRTRSASWSRTGLIRETRAGFLRRSFGLVYLKDHQKSCSLGNMPERAGKQHTSHQAGATPACTLTAPYSSGVGERGVLLSGRLALVSRASASRADRAMRQAARPSSSDSRPEDPPSNRRENIPG